MKNISNKRPNGYLEGIQKGLEAGRTFKRPIKYIPLPKEESLKRLKREVQDAEVILVGAGAGLSTAAGLTYSGERFDKYFFDFKKKIGIEDMYSGGFFPFPDRQTYRARWARHIYFNRYVAPPKPVYSDLLSLVRDKDYFVITTNVDHLFQRTGFEKERLFYTQGDYGLFQSLNKNIKKTYDNEAWVMEAMEAQGFVKDKTGVFQVPEEGDLAMKIPSSLIPRCPDDGSKVTMNLRADDSFLEDQGREEASERYSRFLSKCKGLRVLYLELGVGRNTPVIIKYPFRQRTFENPKATYACINYGQSFCPEEIAPRSLCIDSDIGEVLKKLINK